MKPSQPSKPKILSNLKRGFNWLYLLLALLVAEITVIAQVNSPRTMSIFLFLLVLLVGLSLELGRLRGLLVWLLVMFVWIAAKRTIGGWTGETLLSNLLEMTLLLSLAWIAGTYRDRQVRFWNTYAENELRLRPVQLEEAGIGLLLPSLGRLRLEEEEERAFRYQRPLALLLLHLQTSSHQAWEPRDLQMVLKSVSAAIKDAASETDIPFLVENNRMGLILPETDATEIQSVLDRLTNNLQNLRFVKDTGESVPLTGRAQLRYGYAVYLGESPSRPDMMPAALASLEHSIKANQSPVFQNLFIEYQLLGAAPAQQPSLQGS